MTRPENNTAMGDTGKFASEPKRCFILPELTVELIRFGRNMRPLWKGLI
jgi:hypothetical protein